MEFTLYITCLFIMDDNKLLLEITINLILEFVLTLNFAFC